MVPIVTKPEWIEKINPGISSYAGKTAKEIWNSHLKLLVDKASSVIPRRDRRDTPIFFLATAGLRLLPEDERNRLLGIVRSQLAKTSFQLGDVAMIDGESEGLYGWLGLNYLIHTRNDMPWTDFGETYGFMDMGGASTQIAFVPNQTESQRHHDDLYTLNMRTTDGNPVSFKLFVTTWLGYGANQAQKRWRQFLIDEAPSDALEPVDHDSAVVLRDPCLQRMGMHREMYRIKDQDVEVLFFGDGDFGVCEQKMEALLNNDKPCKDDPCLFNGTHVPGFDTSVHKFVGISEYWYSAQDIFQLEGKFDYATVLEKAAQFCNSDWADVKDNFDSGAYNQIDEAHLKQSCFKAVWVLTVLHKGFKFPLNPQDPMAQHNFLDPFQSAYMINDLEVSWTMGKALMFASSQVPSDLPTRVGYTSDKGLIYAEPEYIPVASEWTFWHVLFAFAFISLILSIVYSPQKIRKTVQNAWSKAKSKNQTDYVLPVERSPRSSVPYTRSGTPFYELLDLPSPGTLTAMSTTVPVSRAPSRVSSRTNIAEGWD